MHPDVDVVLSIDTEMMPWGPLSDELVAERSLLCATAAADVGAAAIVMACNTASVLALDQVRERFEPDIPVIGTVVARDQARRCSGSTVRRVGYRGHDWERLPSTANP